VGSEHNYDFTAASPKEKGEKEKKEASRIFLLHLKRICTKGIYLCQI
jgi:hypothetical protein